MNNTKVDEYGNIVEMNQLYLIMVPLKIILDSNSYKIEEKITGQAGNNSTKNFEVMVPFKYFLESLKTAL